MTISTVQPRSHRPRRTLRAGLAVLAAAGLVLSLAACGDDDDSATDEGDEATSETESGGAGTADATLTVDSLEYQDVTVPAGGTLEIVNTSGVGHTFTAEDDSFDEDYGSDETITVQVPDDPGDYPFVCEIHPQMTGTLTVE